MSDASSRKADLDATMQVMDEHPDYVPDMYAAVKEHRKTLDALLELAGADMNDEEMARIVAKQLAAHPDALERVVRDAIDAASKTPAARAALDKAISERGEMVAGIMADEPAVDAQLVKALVESIEKRPAARAAVMNALRELSPPLVTMMSRTPRR